MNMLQHLLDTGILIEAVEFGKSDEFFLFSRRAGQRREHVTKLTPGQFRLVLAAMEGQGALLMDVIDELYEKHQQDYAIRFRESRLRIELRKLFGMPFSLVPLPGLPKAA